MKPVRPRAAAAALALTALAPAADAATAACRAVSPAHTVALIELYTSQGCSSCPPADDWLSRLQLRESPPRAIALALHVGYWDYIGWKDPFARREFNERQRRLASRAGTGAYTPEVFVAGAELTGWGRRERFEAALQAVNSRASRARIEVQAHWAAAAPGGDPGVRHLAVQADWSAEASARQPQLLLAVKGSGYVTDVGAGENRGSRLRNDHVVRAWEGPFAPAQRTLTADIAVPAGTGDAALVAIAQDAASGELLQAVELALGPCGDAPAPGAGAAR